MLLTLATSAAALAIGALTPTRWGIFGFLGAAALLFLGQAAIRTASGFSGSTIEESLILFNGSWTSYIGFNLQLTYRAFAGPVGALAGVLIWRLTIPPGRNEWPLLRRNELCLCRRAFNPQAVPKTRALDKARPLADVSSSSPNAA